MQSEYSSSSHSHENARLLKALRESELLRELSELLASSLDPMRILQVLVRRTTEVCDVERCAVWLRDDIHSRLIPSAYHFSTLHAKDKMIQIADRMWRQSILPFNDPIFHHLLQSHGLLALEDLSATPGMGTLAERFFVRSVLLVALVREGRPVGMMSLDNPGKFSSFSEEQQQLARAIGQQAAVAIDNAHAYQQAQRERRRAERLIERAQSTYQVALAVNSGEDLPQILDSAMHHLVQGLDTHRGAVALLNKDLLTLTNTMPATPALPVDTAKPSVAITTLQQCQVVAKRGTPLFVTQEQFVNDEQQWFRQLGMENVLIIPLMIGGKHKQERNTGKKTPVHLTRNVGFIFVSYTKKQSWPKQGQYAFAQDIAAQCALAIEKEQILHKARQAVTLANERANTLDAVFNAMTEGIIVLEHGRKSHY